MTRRSQAFWYNTASLAILIGVAIAHYATGRGIVSGRSGLHDALVAAWFAVLGGVAISYKGIVDHRTELEWRNGWITWYMTRPFSSFVVGVVTYELLQIANTNAPPSLPALAVVAFVFGTQERRFFAFLYQVARLVLNTPGDESGDLQVTSIQPDRGAAGSLLIVQGQGFQPDTTATIGGVAMTQLVPSADGTTLAGIVPAGNGDQELIVTNPDNSARRAPRHFTYQQQQ
ncbi:MAG: IPT/TIG domain-containing protein [Candidatus Dormibacteria bacterium]